jgi:hypothetical protein
MSDESMPPERPTTRRELLRAAGRWTAGGLLVALGGVLLGQRSRPTPPLDSPNGTSPAARPASAPPVPSPIEQCINNGRCGRCSQKATCNLPRAVRRRKTAGPGRAPHQADGN